MDGEGDRADPIDRAFDPVAGFHGAYAFRRAGEDHVTRVEVIERRQVRNDLGDAVRSAGRTADFLLVQQLGRSSLDRPGVQPGRTDRERLAFDGHPRMSCRTRPRKAKNSPAGPPPTIRIFNAVPGAPRERDAGLPAPDGPRRKTGPPRPWLRAQSPSSSARRRCRAAASRRRSPSRPAFGRGCTPAYRSVVIFDCPRSPGFSRISTRRSASFAVIRLPASIIAARMSAKDQAAG